MRPASTRCRCAALFNEELGAVLQVRAARRRRACARRFARHGLARCVHAIGRPQRRRSRACSARRRGCCSTSARTQLRGVWSETTHAMQRAARRPGLRRRGAAARVDPRAIPGLTAQLTFDPDDDVAAPLHRARRAARASRSCASRASTARSRWRRRSTRAGFEAVDVHMTDILAGPRRRSTDFRGLAACGGFSYGDVLGAGEGWAKSILFNAARARGVRGVLRAPRHVRARRVQRLPDDVEPARPRSRAPRTGRASCATAREQFEARLALVDDRAEPVDAVRRHGGLAHRRSPSRTAKGAPSSRADGSARRCERSGLVAARFVDSRGRVAERYPRNPNGSPRRHHRAHHARRPRRPS